MAMVIRLGPRLTPKEDVGLLLPTPKEMFRRIQKYVLKILEFEIQRFRTHRIKKSKKDNTFHPLSFMYPGNREVIMSFPICPGVKPERGAKGLRAMYLWMNGGNSSLLMPQIGDLFSRLFMLLLLLLLLLLARQNGVT